MCLDHHVPLNTVCVPLNPRIPLHDGNTLLANPKGGTTVRFSLLSKPLPDAGWLAAELAPLVQRPQDAAAGIALGAANGTPGCPGARGGLSGSRRQVGV